MRRWSKLQSRIEALWAPSLRLAIYCNVWVKRTKHFDFDEPRHWITLDRAIVWDFPGPFMRSDPPYGKPISNWEEVYGWRGSDGTSSAVATLLRDHLDRDRTRLFEPFEDDDWGLGDILRAADRRIGRDKLRAWSAGLDPQNPGLPIVARRLHQTKGVR